MIETPTEGSTLYYSTLPCDDQTRTNAVHLLNFQQTLSSIITDVTEPTVAEKKIHWWHEEIDRLYAGESRHPACKKIQSFVTKQLDPGLPGSQKRFLTILAVNNNEKFENAADMESFHRRLLLDYSARLELMSFVLGFHSAQDATIGFSSAPTIGLTTNQPIEQPLLPLQELVRSASIPPENGTASAKQTGKESGKETGEDKSPMRCLALGLGTFDRLRQFHNLYHLGYPVLPDAFFTQQGIAIDKLKDPEFAAETASLFGEIALQAKGNLEKGFELLEQNKSRNAERLLPLYINARLRHYQLTQWVDKKAVPLHNYLALTPLRKTWVYWRSKRHFLKSLAAGSKGDLNE